MADAYNIIGIEITDDLNLIRKSYRDKYAFLQRRLAKSRREGNSSKIEKQIQELNQAFNYFNVRKNNLREVARQAEYAKSLKEEMSIYPKHQRDLLISHELKNMEIKSRVDFSENFIKELERSIDISFKEIEPDIEPEEVTMGVYLRGGHILIDSDMYEIPQGFEGVYALTKKNNTLQFVHIKIKNSTMFLKNDLGDLHLLRTPKTYNIDKEKLTFTFSNVEFNLRKDKLEVNDSEDFIFETDIGKYGLNENIKIYINNTTEDIYNELRIRWEI